METNSVSRDPYWGLLQRREIFFPTLRGWFFLLTACTCLIIGSAKAVHPFLATIDPISGGDLIVEGWMSDNALEVTVVEFKRNKYGRVYVTGGPIEQGSSLLPYTTYAELGAAILRSKGLPPDLVQAVPASKVDRDRTYASAIALKDWLLRHHVTTKTYHVMTVGAHARRSRLLFERALGRKANVGVTGIQDTSYDPDRWWNTSAGVRVVIGETIAFIYARFLT